MPLALPGRAPAAQGCDGRDCDGGRTGRGRDAHRRLGLGEYLAQDDREAIGLARDVVAQLGWNVPRRTSAPGPTLPADDLLSLMAADLRQPVDMREVMAAASGRLGAAGIQGARYGNGHRVRAGSHPGPCGGLHQQQRVYRRSRRTPPHFIQWMCQLGHPIIYLQNTTGYMVGKDSEQGGMIKHGSKMIQAVTNATVPQITIQCGASWRGQLRHVRAAMRRASCSVGRGQRQR